jgi:hypothetical protein
MSKIKTFYHDKIEAEMKKRINVVVPGHTYICHNFENQHGQTIDFIRKEPKEQGSTELVTCMEGTTNEAITEMLIDRMQYLQSKFPCRENAIVITKLEECLMWLEKRTADRV